MKSFNEILSDRLIENTILQEAVEQKEMVNTFKSLEDVHKKLFPNSWQSVYFSDSSLNIPKSMIIFRSTLNNKWPGNLKENDPMDVIISIQYLGNDKYQAILAKGKYMRTKKSYTSNQLPFRKVSGDAATIIKKITEWENKRKKMFDELKQDIL